MYRWFMLLKSRLKLSTDPERALAKNSPAYTCLPVLQKFHFSMLLLNPKFRNINWAVNNLFQFGCTHVPPFFQEYQTNRFWLFVWYGHCFVRPTVQPLKYTWRTVMTLWLYCGVWLFSSVNSFGDVLFILFTLLERHFKFSSPSFWILLRSTKGTLTFVTT